MTVIECLRWGAYCCWRSSVPPRRYRRVWAQSALLVVDTMQDSEILRENLAAFRSVHEARKLIETGMLGGRYAYVTAARKDLQAAVAILEADQ